MLLHESIERQLHDSLDDALEVVTFVTAEEARRVLGIFSQRDPSPPFDFGGAACAAWIIFAPLHPSLRAMSVREVASAWAIADYLCLGGTHTLVEDLVQRYAENPAAVADWRADISLQDCPACDTLWALATAEFSKLVRHWDGKYAVPAVFGALPPAEACALLVAQRRACMRAARVDVRGLRPSTAGAVTPIIYAFLRSSTDEELVKAAVGALASIHDRPSANGRPEYPLAAYMDILERAGNNILAVRVICDQLAADEGTIE